MSRLLVMVCAMLVLNACAAKDERYYRLNPQALQEALKECPQKQPAQVSCQQLQQTAIDVNLLAYELRMNPQGFGQKILALQEELAKQQQELTKNPTQQGLQASIANNQKQLTEHLAIVKWLESPKS